jgi:hypothetical protein
VLCHYTEMTLTLLCNEQNVCKESNVACSNDNQNVPRVQLIHKHFPHDVPALWQLLDGLLQNGEQLSHH